MDLDPDGSSLTAALRGESPGTPELGALDLLGDPVLVLDADLKVVRANTAACEVFAWRECDLVGGEALALLHPGDAEAAMAGLASLTQPDTPESFEAPEPSPLAPGRPGTPLMALRVRQGDGRYRLVEALGRLGNDTTAYLTVTLRDITTRHLWQAVGPDGDSTAQVLEHAPLILFLCDSHGVLRGASAALARQLGHSNAEVVGRPLAELVPPDAIPEFERHMSAAGSATGSEYVFETRLRPAGSSGASDVLYQLRVVNRYDDLAVGGLVIAALDLGEHDGIRDRLTHLATHDDLTGLPNRALVIDRLEHALAAGARGSEEDPALVFIDLDDFEALNDAHGHRTGDRVLIEVARRLEANTRGGDTVARIGGDEFLVLCESISRTDLARMLYRLDKTVSKPIDLGGLQIEVTAAFGSAMATAEQDLGELLQAADKSMYAAKSGRGSVAHDPAPSP